MSKSKWFSTSKGQVISKCQSQSGFQYQSVKVKMVFYIKVSSNVKVRGFSTPKCQVCFKYQSVKVGFNIKVNQHKSVKYNLCVKLKVVFNIKVLSQSGFQHQSVK